MTGGFNDAGGFTFTKDQPIPAPALHNDDPWHALLIGRGRRLDDTTLTELFLGIATNRQSHAPELANILVNRFGSFAAILSASEQELSGIGNIGTHAIPAIRLLQEAALRYNRARMDQADVLSDEPKLLDYLTARLSRENIEQFRILFLSENRTLLADEAQARGTVNHTPVYPREVARRAMELGAQILVLVHNHPSGDPTPSEADLQMTRQVQAAVALIGVEIADHIIIGNGRHTSFKALDIL
ncbi:JAB domain-containing protein [Kozakia baliensis]|uniref:JAB domain-containing protein n=1 Tax=Kozakia baliensis TaxID=153496 RepID=UPI0009DFFD99|nr:DNA repair protein RadC [Kozakia baliensis]